MGDFMVKRALMIAFHYPPLRGSSGIQRTLKFSRYLPEFGWEPIVLTAHPRAYQSVANDQIDEITDQVIVRRAFALDTSRHLCINGRYPGWLALPDRWASWCMGAIPAGLQLIRKYRPDVIWSSYPIATAHLIGLSLHSLTGIPWVADFRDPMIDGDYPPNPLTRSAYQWIEKKTIAHCSKAVCTTSGTIKLYESRFPQARAGCFQLIENGYDEENFAAAQLIPTTKNLSAEQPFVLVHSGIIYPSERDPVPFFEALASMSEQGRISFRNLKVILRATAHDNFIQSLLDQYAINDLVTLAPPIPYQDALSEMLTADGLLILQASNCNRQIPAKLYECLRARRPILALTDPAGDTAAALRKAGVDTIAALDSKNDIMQMLDRFLMLSKENKAPIASMENVLAYSRRARTQELATLFDDVACKK